MSSGWFRWLLGIVVVLAVVAFGFLRWGSASPAAADAHRRAIRLFDAMQNYSGTTALDQAHDVAPAKDVRIMVARNTTDGHEIVLAVTGHAGTAHRYDLG